MATHVVIGDPHARPDFNNDRAIWLGRLIADLRPDVVVNIGDCADMESLSSYDKGTRGAIGRTYQKDVDAAVDFNDKLFNEIKRLHRKRPRRIITIGNHEQRIDRALDSTPELVGKMGYDDLQYQQYYDDVVPYDGTLPGAITVDGVTYAHFFMTGISGRPIGGEHPAYSLITKNFVSSTQGHSHLADFCDRVATSGQRILGMVAGCFFDGHMPWAGEMNRMYWRGVVIKRNVENGVYDPEFVSIARLRSMYGAG